MPDFNAKMHQNRFRLGFRSRPLLGSLQRSPLNPAIAGFKGPISKGRGGKERGGLGWEVGRGRWRRGGIERGEGGRGMVKPPL